MGLIEEAKKVFKPKTGATARIERLSRAEIEASTERARLAHEAEEAAATPPAPPAPPADPGA